MSALKAGGRGGQGKMIFAAVKATLRDESGGTESKEGPRVAYLVICQAWPVV